MQRGGERRVGSAHLADGKIKMAPKRVSDMAREEDSLCQAEHFVSSTAPIASWIE
jgi:hypothetical protein